MPRTIRQVVLRVVCFATALSAQSGYATLSGRVSDITGAVMPGVVLSARNVGTNVVLNMTSNFLGTSTNPTSDDRRTGRLDQNWSSKHISHFTLTRDDNKSTTPNWLSALQTHTVSYATSHTAALEHTWAVSPSLMLDFQAGLVRIASWSGAQVDANSSTWPMQNLITNLIGTCRGGWRSDQRDPGLTISNRA